MYTLKQLLLSMPLPVFSQNQQIDSLKGIIETGAKDTLMVNRLNELSIELLKDGKFSESFVYGEQANELATQLDFKKGKAKSLKNIVPARPGFKSLLTTAIKFATALDEGSE